KVMREGRVQMVVVGADRIAANGDTANKIGTYGVALLARAHGIPFYVAAPSSTFDLSIPDGSAIPIEQRDPREVTHGFGRQTAPDGVDVYNPAFDVTPAELIAGIITEKGVIRPANAPTIRGVLGGDSNPPSEPIHQRERPYPEGGTMADGGPSLDEVRQRLIELIEDEEWRITERAERTGREFLRRFIPVPTQLSIVRHVLQLLRQDDCCLILVPMGEPPGSRGLGYRLRDPVSPNLYIKVKIEEDLAWIISFKESKHSGRP